MGCHRLSLQVDAHVPPCDCCNIDYVLPAMDRWISGSISPSTQLADSIEGINAILYYAPQIFNKLGMSSNATSLLATGVVGIVMFIATIPAVMYVDKLGRKPVLIVGAIGMATCHIIIVCLPL